MDGAFFQSAAYFPMPVMLIATRDRDGRLNLAPYSQCFPQPSAGEQHLMLIARSTSKTARNILTSGRASLCFLPEEPHLLDNCMELSRPLPTDEKMRSSIFTTVEHGGRPVVTEAEQVFLCSFVEEPERDAPGERAFLLRVDKVLMKPRWLRALERGWGAPRLAVEFGFRGSSARWLSRPRVRFSGAALRPHFEVIVDMTAADAAECLQRALDAHDTPVHGFARKAEAQVNIPADEAHFWSPELSIKIDEVDGRARLRGRVGPHPQVWMMFLGLHMAIAICSVGGALLGFSQWILGNPAWGFWAVPAGMFLSLLTASAAFVGQGLGADHVFRLRAFVDDALTR